MLLSSKCRVVSWCRGLRASEGNTLILLFVRERDCSCSATSEQHVNYERVVSKTKNSTRVGSVLLQANKMRTNTAATKAKNSTMAGSCFATGEQHENKKFKTRKAQGITKNPKRTARVRQIKKDVRSTEV
jgi:hypothetical protein